MVGLETKDLDLGRSGRLALGAIALHAVLNTLTRSTFDATTKVEVTLAVALYVGLGFMPAPAKVLGAWNYLLIQNVLAASIVWMGRWATGLVPLPVLAQFVLVGRRDIAITAAVIHAVNSVVVVLHYFPTDRAVPLVGGFMTAEVFVIAFMNVARLEKVARTDLAAANSRLSEYATQSEELATVRERNRLARELHDSLGHYLTVIHVQLQAAESQLGKDEGRAKAALSKAVRLTHDGLDDIRRSVAALRASPMDSKSLPDALRGLTDELSSSGTTARVDVDGEPRALSPAVELTLYRAAQEALTNVRKHSGARTATVTLAYEAGRVRLTVADDGRGSDRTEFGFGLLGVEERVRLAQGEVEIRPSPSFTLTLTLPA